jgi:hypothetical protein
MMCAERLAPEEAEARPRTGEKQKQKTKQGALRKGLGDWFKEFF